MKFKGKNLRDYDLKYILWKNKIRALMREKSKDERHYKKKNLGHFMRQTPKKLLKNNFQREETSESLQKKNQIWKLRQNSLVLSLKGS